MINTLVGMGLAGSAVLALWLPLSKLLKNRLPARWHYRILKVSLFFFLVPAGRLIPFAVQILSALAPVPAPVAPALSPAPFVPNIPAAVIPQVPTPVYTPAPAPLPEAKPFALSPEDLRVLAVIWAVGAVGMLLYKACVYFRLRRHVFRQNRPVSSREAQLAFWSCKRQLGLRAPVALWENPGVRSPFATGLSRPAVVIPAVSLNPEELRYLLLHELTHIKCGDLWVRFASMIALAVHWYNPLAYLLCRNIQTVSEQSCDERIACPLSPAERYVYGSVIMKLATNVSIGSADWAASLSTRESIERRLIRVLRTEKLKGPKRLAALALALSILACGGGAALAAKAPLPVSQISQESNSPAHTVHTEKTPTAKSGENAIPSTVAPVESSEPEKTVPDKAVTYNGTPSEEFLKALREEFHAAEDTPVLFGDHELILQRGGTLLPDEEFTSYTAAFTPGSNPTCLGIYKQFYTKESGIDPQTGKMVYHAQEEYQVGNKDVLKEFKLELLKELVNGEYPVNSLGESYGSDGLSGYVGYSPDLIAALGTKNEEGYICRDDEWRNPHNLPEDECPHEFLIPLYDKEHKEIGKFGMDCGGHMDFAAAGIGVDDAKAAIAAGATTIDEAKAVLTDEAPTYDNPSEATLAKIRESFALADATASIPVRFGDKELILSRGGTILPDNDPDSYYMVNASIYKCFLDKNGMKQVESLVGNKNALRPLDAGLLDTLTPDGDYPKNSKGESYGHINLVEYVGYCPDLEALAATDDRPAGYITSRSISKWRELNPGPIVPLYDSERNVIGEYNFGGSVSGGSAGPDTPGGPDTSGMSVEEAKAFFENPANT